MKYHQDDEAQQVMHHIYVRNTANNELPLLADLVHDMLFPVVPANSNPDHLQPLREAPAVFILPAEAKSNGDESDVNFLFCRYRRLHLHQ